MQIRAGQLLISNDTKYHKMFVESAPEHLRSGTSTTKITARLVNEHTNMNLQVFAERFLELTEEALLAPRSKVDIKRYCRHQHVAPESSALGARHTDQPLAIASVPNLVHTQSHN